MTDISRLPGPQSDLWEWQLQGACRSQDTELFFHPEGERGPRRSNREAVHPRSGSLETHAAAS
jgi:WhiB family redox-sensing transcriptional regulator